MARRRTTRRTGGPYLTGAFFCERAMFENDGVPSYFRVVDVLSVEKPEPDEMPPKMMPVAFIHAVVMLKSGDAEGERTLTIDCITPSGEMRAGNPITVTLLGGEKGINV